MKKIFLTSLFLSAFVSITYSQSAFKVTSTGLVQVGPLNNGMLTIGQSTSTTNNGNWSLENCNSCPNPGLNFWKPWPTASWGNYKLYIRDNGKVGINCDGDNTYQLKVNGSIYATSSVTWASDKRFKTNIVKVENSLEKLLKINTYSYKFIQINEKSRADNFEDKTLPSYNFDDKTHFGVLAQELETVFPELVQKDDNGYLGVKYTELIPVLIGAVQEQQKLIQQLQKEIINLQKQ
jgi:hypothetical protein